MEAPQGYDSAPPFKSRYKPVVTEEETRNPTTHKKFYASPVQFKRSQPYVGNPFLGRVPRIASFEHSIEEELKFMQAKKLQYMRLGRYKKAQEMHNCMQRARSMSAREEVRRVVRSQKKMKRSITVAHKEEMHFLKQKWGEYFERLRERESNIIEAFQEMQKVDIQEARNKLEKRCQSLRVHSKDLKELARKEEYYMKVGNFKELSYIRKQINNAVKKDKEERAKLIAHWAEIEEGKLALNHSKRYSTLVNRLEEYRQNKEKIYMREQKRLKQKYKNVLLQLEHDQKLELYQVNKEISFDSLFF